MADEYLLEMTGISKSFPGVQALSDVQLKVRPGEVHALMGENGAGKSTLMKCLFGIYKKDSGDIVFQGKQVEFVNPSQALQHGVAMVQQELEQVPNQSIMDNIWLGRFPGHSIFVDDRKMYSDTVELLKNFGLQIDPKTKINQLSVSTKQMVDIIKAVSYDAKIIVLDEPTSSLTERETENLFRIIRRLQQEGRGIIYISHKIDEVLTISDQVTILRDGHWVATEKTESLDAAKLIRMMVAREMNDRFPARNNQIGEIILQIKNLTTQYAPVINDVSFEVHAGEILGIGGLVGAGRTEVLESILGIRKKVSGEILIDGHPINSVKDAHKMGITLLTEERRETGIFPLLDIRWNTVVSSIQKVCSRLGIISMKKVEDNTQWSIDSLSIKTPSQKTLISNLSGGNQQKVLLGRSLLTDPKVLLLDEPTRGIDVGAKYEIYQLMVKLAKEGKTIVFVSSEMPELIGMSDRIVVMSNGRVAGIVDGKTATQETILELATKYL